MLRRAEYNPRDTETHDSREPGPSKVCGTSCVWNGSWVPLEAWRAPHRRWVSHCNATVVDVPKLGEGEAHVKLQEEMATLSALSPLRRKLWLIVGTSIDHDVFKLLCNAFRQERKLTSYSDELALMSCVLPPISFKLVFVSGRGLLTQKLSGLAIRYGNASTRRVLLERADIERRVQRLRSAFVNLSLPHPSFISLAGTEWDFQTWSVVPHQSTEPHLPSSAHLSICCYAVLCCQCQLRNRCIHLAFLSALFPPSLRRLHSQVLRWAGSSGDPAQRERCATALPLLCFGA